MFIRSFIEQYTYSNIVLLRHCFSYSLDELVKHERNGLVFDTEAQLAEQLQVG